MISCSSVIPIPHIRLLIYDSEIVKRVSNSEERAPAVWVHHCLDCVGVDDFHPRKGRAQLEASEHDFVQDVATEADLGVGRFDCLEKPEIEFAEERLSPQDVGNTFYDFEIELFLDGDDCFDGLEYFIDA